MRGLALPSPVFPPSPCPEVVGGGGLVGFPLPTLVCSPSSLLSPLPAVVVGGMRGAACQPWAPHGFHATSQTARLGLGVRGCHRRRASIPARRRRPCRTGSRTRMPDKGGMALAQHTGVDGGLLVLLHVSVVLLALLLPIVGGRPIRPMRTTPLLRAARGLGVGTQWMCVAPACVAGQTMGCRPIAVLRAVPLARGVAA